MIGCFAQILHIETVHRAVLVVESCRSSQEYTTCRLGVRKQKMDHHYAQLILRLVPAHLLSNFSYSPNCRRTRGPAFDSNQLASAAD
jgi:hypothetical protein